MELFGRYKKAYEMTAPTKNDFILDIGSSSGFFTKKLPCRTIGIDVDKEKIKRANDNLHKSKKFIIASATNLPFKNNIFFKVTMFETLEHVQNHIKTIKEIHRVLKDEGILIISVPNRGIMEYLDLGRWLYKHKHYSYQELKKLLKFYFSVEEKFIGGSIWTLFDFYLYATKYSLMRKFIKKPSDIIITPTWLKNKMNKEFEKEKKHGFTIFIKGKKMNLS